MPHPDLALELVAFLQRREPRSLFPLGSIRIADLPEHLRSDDLVNYCQHHSLVESSWIPKDAPNYSSETAGWRLSIGAKGAADLAEGRLTDRTGTADEAPVAAAPARSPTPPPGPTRWETRSTTTTDARYLAFELWKLLRTGERFSDLRRRYDTVRSLSDGGGASSSQYARRHRWVMRLGGTLNRARFVLGGRIRRCRQKVNGLAAGPHAGEPWRTDARRRLAPALTDLTDAIQRTLEDHPESGAGPTHAEILGAIDRHVTDIRECGQFLSDVAAEGREAAVANALNRYPRLLDALIYLSRRNDIRPTTHTEREGGNEHRSHVAGEPIAFALTWVHGRCTWPSRRNGAELWDYVDQSGRGGIVDAEVREVVVPELRAVDTAETRLAFWLELLSRFPHVANDLLASAPAPTADDLLAFLDRCDPDIDERARNAYGKPLPPGEVSTGTRWYRHAHDMAMNILNRNRHLPPLPLRADDPADGLRDLRQWCIDVKRAQQPLSDKADGQTLTDEGDSDEHAASTQDDELISCKQAAKLWPRAAPTWRKLFGNEIELRGIGKRGAKLCSLRDVARYAQDNDIPRL